MGDAELQSLLTHTVDVYHHEQTATVDGQLVEGYPDTPDISGLACAITFDGKTLSESPVGYLIESDAIMYCENADIRELDKLVWTDGGDRAFYVAGTPSAYHDYLGATPDVPHLLEIGLKEEKRSPA